MTIVLLICMQSLTTSNACGVGNHDEHFYVSICLLCYKFVVILLFLTDSHCSLVMTILSQLAMVW